MMSDAAMDDAALDELAEGMRTRDLDVGWAVETVLPIWDEEVEPQYVYHRFSLLFGFELITN